MIFRVNKNKNYTTMSNYHIRDKNLSFKAKGLLTMMLSLPDDWDYSINGIISISKENETSVKSTLKELKQNKYLEVTKLMPNETKSGRIEYRYDIYEIPKQEVEKQEVENLGVEILGVEKQEVENQVQINTKEQITKKLITENNNNIIREVVDYLNTCGEHENFEKVVKFRFKDTSNYIKKIITARINEGYTLDDFKDVIFNCYNKFVENEFEGLNKKSSIQYYNPEVMFTSEKMVKYLNEYDNTREVVKR